MDKSKEVPQEVKESQFGCGYCLWAGVECKKGERYSLGKSFNGKPSCGSYTYYASFLIGNFN